VKVIMDGTISFGAEEVFRTNHARNVIICHLLAMVKPFKVIPSKFRIISDTRTRVS